jgi:hypothetical protein
LVGHKLLDDDAKRFQFWIILVHLAKKTRLAQPPAGVREVELGPVFHSQPESERVVEVRVGSIGFEDGAKGRAGVWESVEVTLEFGLVGRWPGGHGPY